MKLWVWFHYGEWYGSKIQRWYGLKEKRFALFYVKNELPSCCETVPLLYKWDLNDTIIQECLNDLKVNGSRINNMPNPEGIVIYHTQSNQVYKVLIENDNIPKWLLK